MIALTALLSVLAWAMLSMAMPKHADAVLKRHLGETGAQRLRWAGMLLLFVGAYAVIAEKGWEFGAVYWLGIIMLTGMLWVLVLTKITAGKPARNRKPQSAVGGPSGSDY
jgi:hypothetical protein